MSGCYFWPPPITSLYGVLVILGSSSSSSKITLYRVIRRARKSRAVRYSQSNGGLLHGYACMTVDRLPKLPLIGGNRRPASHCDDVTRLHVAVNDRHGWQ